MMTMSAALGPIHEYQIDQPSLCSPASLSRSTNTKDTKDTKETPSSLLTGRYISAGYVDLRRTSSRVRIAELDLHSLAESHNSLSSLERSRSRCRLFRSRIARASRSAARVATK